MAIRGEILLTDWAAHQQREPKNIKSMDGNHLMLLSPVSTPSAFDLMVTYSIFKLDPSFVYHLFLQLVILVVIPLEFVQC